MNRITLPAKRVADQENVPFDFTSNLGEGETLSSATVTSTVYSGTDASPSSMISGSASVSGGIATQLIIGGVEGVVYEIVCTALTTNGQTLVLPGFLAVIPVLT